MKIHDALVKISASRATSEISFEAASKPNSEGSARPAGEPTAMR